MKKIFYPLFVCVALIMATVSCSVEKETPVVLSTDYLELYVGDSFPLKCNRQDVTLRSANELIATIQNGLVRGVRVGETEIRAGGQTCKVKVYPSNTLFTEPQMLFGATKTEIKNSMSGYELQNEKSNGLTYKGKGRVLAYAYLFTAGRMSMSALTIDPAYCNNMLDFLNERYVLMETTQRGADYQYGFVSLDGKIAIVFDSSPTAGGMVTYSD